jgi:nucleoside-diphosphate-sugar epimerase
MEKPILITGSSGCSGTALRKKLCAQRAEFIGLDLCNHGAEYGDIRNTKDVIHAVEKCSGIIHLAAISRVVWSEQEPSLCHTTNVEGVNNLLRAALCQEHKPWFLFASSREVYGQTEQLPATEATPLRPINAYGRSKADGERLVEEARCKGLQTAIIRLPNVYGSVHDHPDRVVPAFIQCALKGLPLRIDGASQAFDFLHVNDVLDGFAAVMARFREGISLPPLQLVSGIPTTLQQLAEQIMVLTGTNAPLHRTSPHSFQVSRFYGCPKQAFAHLGWRANIELKDGLSTLINDYRTQLKIQTEQDHKDENYQSDSWLPHEIQRRL